MQYKDYYVTLGLERDAEPADIKRAYRKLARKYHPDVSTEKDAEEHFKEVQEAYEVLKDADKREAYNRLGRNWQQGEDFAPPPGGEAPAGGEPASEVDFGDFFARIFGARPGQPPASDRGFQLRGQDRTLVVQITLDDSFTGAARALSLVTPELDSAGEVRSVRKTVNITLPRGVIPGQRIRLAGQGGSGFNGGPAGDLFLEVEFEPHPLFHAEGRDIYLDLPLTPWEAALGARVVVPTLGGQVEMNIPPGVQSGKKLRLAGRGLPGKQVGDQYIVIGIFVPPAQTDEQQALYREMAALMPVNPRAAVGV